MPRNAPKEKPKGLTVQERVKLHGGLYPGFKEKLAEGYARAQREKSLQPLATQTLLASSPSPKAAADALQAAIRLEMLRGANIGRFAQALVRDAIKGQGSTRVAARDAILKRLYPTATEGDTAGRKILEGIKIELSDGRLQTITLASSASPVPSRSDGSGTPTGGALTQEASGNDALAQEASDVDSLGVPHTQVDVLGQPEDELGVPEVVEFPTDSDGQEESGTPATQTVRDEEMPGDGADLECAASATPEDAIQG